MTDESQTQGQSEEQSNQQPNEQSEGLMGKLVSAAKHAGEKISDVVETVVDKVEDVAGDLAERVGLKDADAASDAADETPAATLTADTTDTVAAPKGDGSAAAAPKGDDSAAAAPKGDDSTAAAPKGDDSTAAAPTATAPKGDDSAAAAPKGDDSTAAAPTATAPKGDDSAAAAPTGDDSADAPTGDESAAATATAPTGDDSAAAPMGDDSAEGAVFEPQGDDSETTPRRLADLEPGMELDGRVTSTALYGVFVDIGVGRDGLVHISEMSDQRIDSPTDVVQIGDTVKVRVKSVDPDGRRISLTMRSPRPEGERRRRGPRRPEVDSGRLQELQPGDLVEGTVNGIASFGVFVDIGVGKDGLVHISELSDTRVEKPEDAVAVGETRTFRVLEVDTEGQRISLSLRRAQEGYQERPKGGARRRDVNLDAVVSGQILDGTVSGIAPFGAFVDLGVGRDGLVHISELSEGRVGKVEDVVNVGDAVKVRVIEVDPSSKRISLSMRLETPIGPVSTSGSSRLDRDWTNPAAREDNSNRRSRRDRDDRRPTNREPEVYTFGDVEEEVPVDNATIDDLLLKYSSDYDAPKGRTGKRFERETEDEETEDTRESRARRDAIRRTLRDQDEF